MAVDLYLSLFPRRRPTWALGLVLSFVSMGAWAQVTTLIEFELKDQFDRVYRSSDYEGKVFYLIGSDRVGSKFAGSWSQAIADALKEEGGWTPGSVAMVELADLRGVPFFIKGMVKGKFSQEESQWVLMDWKGTFPKAYDFSPDSSNILVFAADGRLAHQAQGREVDQEVLDGVVRKLRELLAGD